MYCIHIITILNNVEYQTCNQRVITKHAIPDITCVGYINPIITNKHYSADNNTPFNDWRSESFVKLLEPSDNISSMDTKAKL